jgi:hypothetical protein
MNTLPGATFLFKFSQKSAQKMHFFKVQFLNYIYAHVAHALELNRKKGG